MEGKNILRYPPFNRAFHLDGVQDSERDLVVESVLDILPWPLGARLPPICLLRSPRVVSLIKQ